MDNSSSPRYTLLGFAAILMWSSTVALARSISEQLGPLGGGAAVYLGASAFLGLSWLWQRLRQPSPPAPLPSPPAGARSAKGEGRLPPSPFLGRRAGDEGPSPRYLLGCGALFVFYTLALFLALGRADGRAQALEIGLLNYLWPALTLLFSLPILGKQARPALLPGTLAALAGVFLVLTQGTGFSWQGFLAHLGGNPLAYGLGAAAAVAWGLYSNLARRWGPARGSGGVPLFTLATGIAFGLAALAYPEPAAAWSLKAGLEVAFLALATGAAYAFWDLAMRAGNLVQVAAASYLTPFFSTVVSSLYLGVAPEASLWLGCGLIIAGSVVSWRSIEEKPEMQNNVTRKT